MSKKRKILIFIILLVLVIGIWSLIQRFNDKPKVHLISAPKKWKFNAITLPPIGIFINKDATVIVTDSKTGVKTKDPTFTNTRLHEAEHWKQFQDQGMLRFYLGYLIGHIQYGYDRNPYEVAARKAAHQCKPFELTDGKCIA